MVQNAGFVHSDNLAPRVCGSGEVPTACHRAALTISPRKWTGVGFMAPVSLLYLETEKAIRDSALIWTREIKLHLHCHEQAKPANPDSTWGLECLGLWRKAHLLAEGPGDMAAIHSSILQFGLIYSLKQKDLWKPQIATAALEPLVAAAMQKTCQNLWYMPTGMALNQHS